MGKNRTFGLTGSLAVLALFGMLGGVFPAYAQAPESPSFGPILAVPPTNRGGNAGEALDLPPVETESPPVRGNSMLRSLFQRPARTNAPKAKPKTHDLRVTRAALDSPPPPTEPAAETPVAVGVRAVGRVEGVAAPGLRIKLSGRGSQGEGLRYLWVQTRGPEVKLERPDDAEISFIVPGEATELGFQLIVAGLGGVDRTAVEVPLQLHAKPSLPAVVVADAGDDQMAIVGHRVTLNGVRCRPREQLAYRWIYVSGPPIRDRSEEAWLCSFVPTAPGLHRFLLVVATDGVISKPDEVIVSVVADSDVPRELARPPRDLGATSRTRRRPLSKNRSNCSRNGCWSRLSRKQRHARDLAGAFDAVADRLALYESYADLFSEISRRLDKILPTEPARREAWDQQVFEPLSDQIVIATQAARSRSHARCRSQPQHGAEATLGGVVPRNRRRISGGGSARGRRE